MIKPSEKKITQRKTNFLELQWTENKKADGKVNQQINTEENHLYADDKVSQQINTEDIDGLNFKTKNTITHLRIVW